MSKWYYTDETGKKSCITGKRLRWLARNGKILPDTVIEAEDGKTYSAENMKCFKFPKTVPPKESPPSEPSLSTPSPVPDNDPLPPKKSRGQYYYWVAIFGVSLVLIGGGFGGFVAWGFFSTRPLVSALREGLDDEIFSKVPIEIANISVKWAKTKTAYAATGEFTVKAKTTENLYKLTDYDAGLQKLGVTKHYEKEYNDVLEKFQSLPVPLQNDLRSGKPQDLAAVRFYDILVSKGDEVTLTGSVELTKHVSGKWLVRRFLLYPFSCGDDFTPESKLQEEECKLDDPQTKEALAAIIRKRETFAAEVEPVWNEWKQEQDAADAAAVKAAEKAEQERVAREAEEQARVVAEQERQRQAAIQDQIDNFGEFCKPGTKYSGSFEFGGVNRAATFDVSVTFDKYANDDTSQSQVEGTLLIRYPGGISSERTFTVAVNANEVTQYPVKGTIDNSTLPTLEDIIKQSRAVSQQGKEDATALYRMLRDNSRIDIQFTDTMQFSIATPSERDRHQFDLQEASGRRLTVKRSIPAQAGGLQAPTQMGGRQAPAMPAGAVSLDEEIRKSGLDNLSDFVRYGSKYLKDRLNEAQMSHYNADAFGKAAAQKKVDAIQSEISAAQAAIAKTTFVSEYTYSTSDSDVKVYDDRSSCKINIDTGFRIPQGRGGLVSFPIPSVVCNVVGFDWRGIVFSINGRTDSIKELVNNSHNYKARIQFKDLRCNSGLGYRVGGDTVANLLKVDIIKTGGEPQEMNGGDRAPRRSFPQN